jgi:hypothetical protein
MRKSIRLVALAGILAFLSPQTRAQDAETIADVRCLALGIKMANSSGIMVALYYLGRLNAHAPQLDIEDRVTQEIGRMTTADYASASTRCGGALREKWQQITRIGSGMSERGRQMLDKSAKK